MEGIYTILLALYFAYVAVNTVEDSKTNSELKSVFTIASLLTMAVSIVVQFLI